MGMIMKRGRKATEPCGTAAAARRHYKNGEKPCQACRLAGNRDAAERRGGESNRWIPDYREVRNGLPEFRPYVYRGAGYDALEGISS